jgi:hypothetical protein
MANLVDLYLVYRILRKLTTPYTEWEAYKTGVLDAEGNIVKDENARKTSAEQESFTKFDLLILKLRKVLEKLPFGKTRLATYAAALFLLKEENNIKDETLKEQFLDFYNNKSMLNEAVEEEIGNTTAGVAGLDGNPPASRAFLRRFAKNDVFVVDTERFNKARVGKKKYVKYEKYVGNDEVGDAIRSYGRKYPKKPIILQDEKTGSMIFLRHGRSGMFTEQFERE